MNDMRSIQFPAPVADAMVRAILDGRKTVTRRVVEPQPFSVENAAIRGGKPPYHPGDILYVRETWRVQSAHRFESDVRVEYKAGGPMTMIQFPGRKSDSHSRDKYDAFIRRWADDKWHPSIHMPKEAARLFIRVAGVQVERLRDITWEQTVEEGVDRPMRFDVVWDSTIKKSDLPRYGWAANPWVWVIAFERISREEARHD